MGNQDTTENSDVQLRLMQMLDSVRLDSDDADRPPQQAEAAVTKEAPVATVDVAQVVPAGDGCTNCGATVSREGGSWCPKCGYYPKLGRTVFDENLQFSDEEEEDDEPLTMAGLIQAVPFWAIILLIGSFAIFVESVAIRVMVPDIYYRGIIALYQLVAGIVIFGLAHLRAYFIAAQDTDKIAFGSMFTAPVKIWSEASKKMPSVQKVFYAGGWGFSLLVLAVLVVGLDWNGLFNPEQYANRPKFNPLKFLMKSAMTLADAQAKSGVAPAGGGMGMMLDIAGAGGGGGGGGPSVPSGGDSLEDAIGGFADVSGVAGFAEGGSGDSGSSEGVSGIESSVGSMLPDGVGEKNSGGGGFSMGVDQLPAVAMPDPQGMTHAQSLKNHAQRDAVRSQQEQLEGVNGEGETGSKDNSLVTTSSDEDEDPATQQSQLRQFPKSDKSKLQIDPARPDQAEYVVIGYTTNAGGELRSLLLAEIQGSRPTRFKTRFQLSQTDQETIEKLEESLKKIRIKHPSVRTPYSASWVKPVVMCKIAYNGINALGNFNDGLVTNYYMLSNASAQRFGASKR